MSYFNFRGGTEQDDEKKVFRKWFRNIGELRSIFPSATLMALSATCTNAVRKRVLSVLGLEKATYISMSPNRENIKYTVCRTENTIDSALFWLVEALNAQKENIPRMIIYCNSIKDVGNVYNFLSGEVESSSSLIDMFHSETPDDKKHAILSALRVKNDLRVVIATSALGMGVDVFDCNYILLYGPPKTIIDLVQETGRCGRDGTKSLAVIFCNQYQLCHIDEDVKNVVKTTKCRRLSILKHFLSAKELDNIEKHMNKHTCCDLCSKLCACGECFLPLEKMMAFENIETISEDESAESSSDTLSYTYESDQFDSDQ